MRKALTCMLLLMIGASVQADAKWRVREAGKRLATKLSHEAVYRLAAESGGFAGTAIRVEPATDGGVDALLFSSTLGRVRLDWVRFPLTLGGDEVEECYTVGILQSRSSSHAGEIVHHVLDHRSVGDDPALNHHCSREAQGAFLWHFLRDRPALEERFLATRPGLIAGAVSDLPEMVVSARRLGYQLPLRESAQAIGMSLVPSDFESKIETLKMEAKECDSHLLQLGTRFESLLDPDLDPAQAHALVSTALRAVEEWRKK